MIITSYRSTYVQQLQSCAAQIRKQSRAYRAAKYSYRQEEATPCCDRRSDDWVSLYASKANMAVWRSLMRSSCEHYRNLRRFERWCHEMGVASKIEQERSVYACWSKAGLPTERKQND